MVDAMKRRELLRLSVMWPLTVKTEKGETNGETVNITGEGMFLSCAERLHEGVAYAVTIKLPEKPLKVTGKVTWSNLDNCTSLNFSPAMGFYFVRIDEDAEKQILREAIVAQGKKPRRLRQEADRDTDSAHATEAKARANLDGVPSNTQVPRS